MGFDGYAVGGLSVGEGHQIMCQVLDYTTPLMPPERPRYLIEWVVMTWWKGWLAGLTCSTVSFRHGTVGLGCSIPVKGAFV